MEKKSVILDDVLDGMELFKLHENRMIERGIEPEAIRATANPSDKYTFFKGKTDRNYRSGCDLYNGYYLDGVHGAVSCSAVGFLLPGVVRGLYCEKNCGECPLHGVSCEERKTDI